MYSVKGQNMTLQRRPVTKYDPENRFVKIPIDISIEELDAALSPAGFAIHRFGSIYRVSRIPELIRKQNNG